METNGEMVENVYTFEDAQKRMWTIELNSYSAKKVRLELGINLYLWYDNFCEKYKEEKKQKVNILDVIHVLCRSQFESQSVTDMQFEIALNGPARGRALDVFERAFINFCDDQRMKALLWSIYAKERELEGLALTNAQMEMEKLTPEWMESQIREKSDELKKKFGVSPESSESTPALTPTASST